MKTSTRNNVYTVVGWLLSVPTAFFILIVILKYELGWPYLYNASEPTLERWGINQPFGWNINVLIVFGPLLALLLNALLTIKVTIWISSEAIDCRVSITKSRRNLLVMIFSAALLLILAAYMVVENCSGCH